jgi:hypothetical protein
LIAFRFDGFDGYVFIHFAVRSCANRLLEMTNAMKVLCFLFLVAQVYSIYEDQVGEYEWQIENLGDINNIVFGSKIVATSQNGVIAAINHREGETEWRNILPEGSQINNITIINIT